MSTGTASSNWRRNWGWRTLAVLFAAKIFWFSGAAFSGARSGAFLRSLVEAFRIPLRPEVFAVLHTTIRKVAHLLEFAFLLALVYRAISNRGWIWQGPVAIRAFLISAGWGAITEGRQHFVQGRTATLQDLLLDAAGAGLMLAVVYVASKTPAKKQPHHAAPAGEVI